MVGIADAQMSDPEPAWGIPSHAPSKYKIDKLLGKGSFGQAWLVKSKNNTPYVMKELRPRSSTEVSESIREAELLFQLSHRHIIKYKEAFVKGKSVFIVMEFAPLGDVFERIDKCKQKGIHLKEEWILRWVAEVCLALQYIHGRGMVHRDIKCSNCFLSSDGSIKLGDFGSSRQLEANHEDIAQRTCRTPAGTPMYMSPEVCRGESYGQKADIWALGCMIYELMSLRHAFVGRNLSSLLTSIKRGHFDRRLPSHYNDQLGKLCFKCLQTGAEKRPTIREILGMGIFKEHIENSQRAMEAEKAGSSLSPVPPQRPSSVVNADPIAVESDAAADTDKEPMTNAQATNMQQRKGFLPAIDESGAGGSHARGGPPPRGGGGGGGTGGMHGNGSRGRSGERDVGRDGFARDGHNNNNNSNPRGGQRSGGKPSQGRKTAMHRLPKMGQNAPTPGDANVSQLTKMSKASNASGNPRALRQNVAVGGGGGYEQQSPWSGRQSGNYNKRFLG